MLDRSSLTIKSIHEGLQSKSFSARELTQDYLNAIDRNDGVINAFLHVDREGALTGADTIDKNIASGKELNMLAGLPISVKDIFHVVGMPTTAASKILKGYMPSFDATAVERLRRRGAIVLGKTNCDEFAMGASGENSAYGATTNPWESSRVPGGSSSGSAASVAAGMAIASLGSDTGGSVRQPAAFCGIVGLKPTYGRISRHGLIAFTSSLDHVGIFSRNVSDMAVLLNATAGVDSHDATSADKPSIDLSAIENVDITGMRIGMPKQYFIDGMETTVEQAVNDVATILKAKGALVTQIDLPLTEYAVAVYYILQPAEASTNLARFDGIRFGPRADATNLLETYMQTRAQGFGPEVKRRIMLGTYALSAGYYDAYYKQAQKVRTLIRKEFASAFESVDAILAPTSPNLPFPIGEKSSDPLSMYLEDVFTAPADIAGIPAISIPAGFGKGLPIGAQILGPMWAEERILGIANVIEQELALPLRLPTLA